jgi:hypothetical protein
MERHTMPKTSWRDTLPIHPAAELFPLMTSDEQRALGADILKNGLTNPIVLFQADRKSPLCLLDGRNRADAIEIAIGSPAEIGPPSISAGKNFLAINKVIVLDAKIDPWAYAISVNVHRRHLTVEQRQHLLIALIARAPEKSDRQIGKEIGVDHKTIASARAKGEDVGSIPHVETRTDSKGRQQAATKPRTVKFTPKRLGQIKDMVAGGNSPADIAATIGVPVASLQTACSRACISLRQPPAVLGNLLKAWDRASEAVRQKFMARVGLVPAPPRADDGLDISPSLRGTA